jgi:hypothetical protein
MNEQVKILWAKAAESNFGDSWEEQTKFMERFAELLIRQCCIALNPMLRDMISRGQGVELIKLHFGMNPKEITTAMLDAAITQCEQELAKKKLGVEE